MTNIVSVPPEMVEQWVDLLESHSDQAVFTLAAHWGYTQAVEELEEFLKKTVDTPCNNSMTDKQHPITPPSELVRDWASNQKYSIGPAWMLKDFAQKAAQWGADQELEACCEWLATNRHILIEPALRAARRLKPPSLKEQALTALHAVATGANDNREQYQDLDTIREALEALPND